MAYPSLKLEDIKAHRAIAVYLEKANEHLAHLGFTEHGRRHVTLVAAIARNILSGLGYPQRTVELAEIAGYCHDLGNVVGRSGHGGTGALLLAPILTEMGMDPEEIAIIVGAIGNHEEEVGQPVNEVGAALILADKSDVHRSRVRNRDFATFDIHDRVNYAVTKSYLHIDGDARTLTLEITIETELTSVMEYFEIFLQRMLMCRRAAEFLDCRFHLEINGAKLL
ncbi:MAG: HD domain-containing protein [Limnochordia bacterium]|jgi:metal-dependent HD superfamily phosphatase/phosphodiesterase